jgi:hypothetical protein
LSKGNFVRFPKELFFNIEGSENNVSKDIMVYYYLARKRCLDDTVNISIKNLIETIGYQYNPRKNKLNLGVKDVLFSFQNKDWIDILNPENLIGNQCCTIKINNQYWDTLKEFTMAYISDIEKITKSKIDTDITITLIVYIYLRYHLRKRYENQSIEFSPSVCIRTFNAIADDIGIHYHTVSKIIDNLVKLDLIMVQKTGKYKCVDGSYKTGATIFTNTDEYGYNPKEELKYGMEILRNFKGNL